MNPPSWITTPRHATDWKGCRERQTANRLPIAGPGTAPTSSNGGTGHEFAPYKYRDESDAIMTRTRGRPAARGESAAARGVCQGGHMTRAQLDKRPGDVAAMFDKVAPRYDLLNDVLSFGQDRWWRKVVAKAVGARAGERVLDLAAGTGTSSVSFTAAGAACVACDFSLGMLRAGAERLAAQDARARPPGSPGAAQAGPVRFVAGDALRLPFSDQ